MNPIQRVLQAQREADEAIEHERARAARALSDARLWSKRLLQRTEARLQRATLRYEQRCAQQRGAEAQVLRDRVARETTRRCAAAERKLDQTVDGIFERHWPGRDTSV